MKTLTTTIVIAISFSILHAADVPISGLPGASVITGTDVVPIVQGSTTKKCTFTVQQNFWDGKYLPDNTAYNESTWNGVTGRGATKNALRDYFVLFDSDGNGKVDVLDQTAGITSTNSSGVIQTALTIPAGALVGTTATQTLTNKRVTSRITSITSSATPTINTDNADCVTITALATAITSMTSGLTGTPVNFDKLIIRIKDDGSPHAITWGASFVSSQSILPTTTVASKVTTVGLIWDSVKTKWVCLAVDQEP